MTRRGGRDYAQDHCGDNVRFRRRPGSRCKPSPGKNRGVARRHHHPERGGPQHHDQAAESACRLSDATVQLTGNIVDINAGALEVIPMGAPLLHAGNQITCVRRPGEAIFTNFSGQYARQLYFMTVGDGVVCRLSGTPPPAQLVCVIAQYAMPATRVFICGQPAPLQSSIATATPTARRQLRHLRRRPHS